MRIPMPGFATLLGLAWALTATLLIVDFWPMLADTLSDSDDAMRLVQVRAFLAGRGWFDLTEPRVQPPLGYETHWSRLIDAGLASLYVLFHYFVDAPLAERLMRAVWPVLWLLPAMGGAAAIAWRLAGREAALIVLLFAFLGAPAYERFNPGRIDHHNVQIALTLLTVAATVWADRVLWCATAAGLLTGLACAIGLESLPYLVLCAAAFGWRYVADRTAAPVLSRYGFAVAVGAAAAFFISVDSLHWLRNACDAIAVNWAAPMMVGGLGAWWLGRSDATSTRRTRRFAVGLLALAVAIPFIALEPRCLAGPYAMMDPAVKPIWLARVREMQPLLALARASSVKAAWIAAYPFAGLLAAFILVRDKSHRREAALLVAGGALLIACLTMLMAMKAYTYAVWLAMPLMAAAAPLLLARFDLRLPAARLTTAAVLSPTAVAAAAIGLAQTIPHAAADTRLREQQACLDTASYAPLAQLPAGVVAADVDYGPYLLALTPHAVVGAPYHRISASILTAHRILVLPPDASRRLLQTSGATYVAICGSRPPPSLGPDEQAASLWGHLRAEQVPAWLEPVSGSARGAFKVYRIVNHRT